MIGNIVNTVVSRIGMAVIAILLLLLNSNFLGSEGLGTVGLIALGIAIYLLVANLICGSSLVYYASRYKIIELLLFAYLWVLISAVLLYTLSHFFGIFEGEYTDDIILLGIIQAGISVHSALLMGKKRIKPFNSVSILQPSIQLLALGTFYFLLREITVDAFVRSTYIAYSAVYFYSLVRVFPLIERRISFPNYQQIRALFHYGFYIQIANISQLLNYRLSYFFLDHFTGRAAVGAFMPAVQFSEGILLPSKSIGMVQYAKITNTRNNNKSALLSLRLMKLVVIITLPLTLILMLIPSSLFEAVLGDDFGNTPNIIAFMAVGIVALAGEMILSRYFSGTANQKINASSSTLGLVATLIAGLLLIPSQGLYGAAITSSISYSCMFVYLLIKMIQLSNLKLTDFWIGKADLLFMRRVLRLSLRKRSN